MQTTKVQVNEDMSTKSYQVGTEPVGVVNALQIFCRLRPLQENPIAESVVDLDQDAPEEYGIKRKSDTVLTMQRPNSFLEQEYLFEHVFDTDSFQADVFDRCTAPLVDSFLAGQDALMFAYGATGSGKSFTIGGMPHHPGIVPRTIDHLFEVLGSRLNTDYHIQPDYQNHYIVNNRPSDSENLIEETDDRSIHFGLSDRKR